MEGPLKKWTRPFAKKTLFLSSPDFKGKLSLDRVFVQPQPQLNPKAALQLPSSRCVLSWWSPSRERLGWWFRRMGTCERCGSSVTSALDIFLRSVLRAGCDFRHFLNLDHVSGRHSLGTLAGPSREVRIQAPTLEKPGSFSSGLLVGVRGPKGKRHRKTNAQLLSSWPGKEGTPSFSLVFLGIRLLNFALAVPDHYLLQRSKE